MRYKKADLVLYFNYPRWICYWRAFKRLFVKHNALDDRATGCKETIRFSLLRYMWTFQKRVHRQIFKLQQEYPLVRFIEIKGDSNLRNLER